MPVERIQLKGAPLNISACPKCHAEPFKPFLRGLVHRRKRAWAFFGKLRPHCAVICENCKDIVAYEAPWQHGVTLLDDERRAASTTHFGAIRERWFQTERARKLALWTSVLVISTGAAWFITGHPVLQYLMAALIVITTIACFFQMD